MEAVLYGAQYEMVVASVAGPLKEPLQFCVVSFSSAGVVSGVLWACSVFLWSWARCGGVLISILQAVCVQQV